MAAAAVIVVVLEEHCGGEHDIGQLGRVGHELLMNDCEQILAGETGPGEALFWRYINGVCVLYEQRLNGAAALQGLGIARQDLADLAHVELAAGRPHRGAVDQRLVELPAAGIGVEGAAAGMLPRAGHGGDRQGGVHGGGAVALPGEAVAEAEIGPGRRADEAGEGFDLLDAKAGDGGSPFGRAGREMRLELG